MQKIQKHNPNCNKAMDYRSWGFIFGLVTDFQTGLVLTNVVLDEYSVLREKTP